MSITQLTISILVIEILLPACYILALLVPEGPAILPEITIPTDESPTEAVVAEDVRTFFPESWIFQLMKAE